MTNCLHFTLSFLPVCIYERHLLTRAFKNGLPATINRTEVWKVIKVVNEKNTRGRDLLTYIRVSIFSDHKGNVFLLWKMIISNAMCSLSFSYYDFNCAQNNLFFYWHSFFPFYFKLWNPNMGIKRKTFYISSTWNNFIFLLNYKTAKVLIVQKSNRGTNCNFVTGNSFYFSK